MFSTKLTRAAHRVAATSCPPSTTSACSGSQCLAGVSRQRSHQRRPSSSKASCPPDSAAGGKPTPAAKADVAADTRSPESTRSSTPKSTKGRARTSAGGFKRLHAQHANKLACENVDQFASLPSVPSIQNLNASDLGLSSFFSLHRPLSLTTPVPPPSSIETFNTIFTRPAQDVWENGNSAEGRPEDIIITLQHTIDSLEGMPQREESESIHWEVVLHNDSDIKHLDGTPKLRSLDELVAQFRPFRTPPPPVPFRDELTIAPQQREKAKKTRKARSSRSRAGQSSELTTTGTITVEVDEPLADVAIREPFQRRHPYLVRIRRRRQVLLAKQQQYPPRMLVRSVVRRSPNAIIREPVAGQPADMHLISVKRQRKLKMKKHKYKKLMKRTRNLRRRQDRL